MNQPFTQPQLDPQPLKVLNQNFFKPISGIVQGAAAQTAANYGTFFVADRAYYVVSVSQNHRVAGTDAGAVTVSVEKCTSGTAPNSGTDILATPFSLKAAINTPQFGTFSTNNEARILRKGDRLILKDAGTLTDVEDVCVTVLLAQI